MAQNIEALLKEGRVACIFDALDEMPRQGYAERFQSLQAFMKAWAPYGNRFVCSCRLQDYDQALDADAVVIAPFDRGRIASFLRRSAPGIAEALVRRIAGDESLEALLSNPFFLQALACINRPFSDAQTRAIGPYVPETRERLIRAFVEALLEEEVRRQPGPLDSTGRDTLRRFLLERYLKDFLGRETLALGMLSDSGR